MRRNGTSVCFLAVTLVLCGCGGLLADEVNTATLIPPPAISVPYGGNVVTEINISDADLLGIIKQIIPAIGEIIQVAAPAMSGGSPEARVKAQLEALQKIDFQGLADAISGIKNIRVLVVKYPRPPEPSLLLKQLDAGVAKLGQFTRIIVHTGDPMPLPFSPSVMAVYAKADGQGYVGYGFERGKLYAFRIVGSADFEKLIKWGTETVKTVFGAMKVEPVSEIPSPQNQ